MLIHTGFPNEMVQVKLPHKILSPMKSKELQSSLQWGSQVLQQVWPHTTANLGGVWMPLLGTDWMVSWSVPL